MNDVSEYEEIELKQKVINGVTFYYDNIKMTDDLIQELEKFSKICEDEAYTICEDDGQIFFY